MFADGNRAYLRIIVEGIRDGDLAINDAEDLADALEKIADGADANEALGLIQHGVVTGRNDDRNYKIYKTVRELINDGVKPSKAKSEVAKEFRLSAKRVGNIYSEHKKKFSKYLIKK